MLTSLYHRLRRALITIMACPISLSKTRIQRIPRTSLMPPLQVIYSAPRHPRPSTQSRGLWGCSHSRYSHDRPRRVRIVQDRHQRPKAARHPRREQTVYDDYQSWGWGNRGFGWNIFKSTFPKPYSFRGNSHADNFWEAEKARAQERLERIKKEIDADPYAALFGRRLEPFGSVAKLENTFTSWCRSILGFGKPSNVDDVKAGKKMDFHSAPKDLREEGKEMRVSSSSADARSISGLDKPSSVDDVEAGKKVDFYSAPKDLREEGMETRVSSNSADTAPSSNVTAYEFDPISGRMVPKTSEALDVAEEREVREGNPTDTQAEGQKGGTGELSSKTEFVESSNPEESRVSKTPKDNKETSTIETSCQDVTPNISPNDKPPVNVLTEAREDAICVEPAQPQDQIKPPAHPAGNDGNDVIALGGAIEGNQASSRVGEIASEETAVEHREQKEGLDRLGFLSRPDKTLPEYTTSNLSQERVAIEDNDADIDLLRASDIRAAYAARRLNGEFDMQRETIKDSADSAKHTESSRDIDHEAQRKMEQGEDTTLSSEISTSAASGPTDEQVGIEAQSQSLNSVSESMCTDSSEDPSVPEVYRVFAYDPSSLQVTEAETSSTLRMESETLHPTQVLPRLNNPAKFLPYLNRMHADGYEIVSGGRDILVFRKAPRLRNQTSNNSEDVNNNQDHLKNAEDASSAQRWDHDGFYTENVPNHPSFVGESHHGSHPRSNARSTLRRMLIGGTATAATCYALGVVVEFFRTGGQDGSGVDGFTEFESERRHREP